jgi:hypothetical protein
VNVGIGPPTGVLVLFAVTVSGAATPVPLKLTCCGLPVAQSEKLNVPIRGPGAVGVKTKDNWQELFAASEVWQLFEVTEKSPVAVTELISSMPAPLLLSVTVWEVFCPYVTLPNAGTGVTLGNATEPESTSAGTSCVLSGGASRFGGVQ